MLKIAGLTQGSMMIVAYLVITLILAFLCAYTAAVQRASKHWGKILAPDLVLMPHGMQEAITPASQTVRLCLVFPLLSAFVITGFVFLRWYIITGLFMLCWLGSSFIRVLFLPTAKSDFFRRYFVKYLQKRRRKFVSEGDTLRVTAVDDVLARLQDPDAASIDPRGTG